MKTEYQIKSFLSRKSVQHLEDLTNIRTICYNKDVPLYGFTSIEPKPSGLTLLQFIDWFENGFGDGEVVLWNGKHAFITEADLAECKIGGYFDADMEWHGEETSASNSEFTKLSLSRQIEVNADLARLGLEYNFRKHRIDKKYTPGINERVVFYNAEKNGLGVVRDIDIQRNTVELYCYYIETDGSVGYSMHETGVVTYREYHYGPMPVTGARRLNRELLKSGKVWKDRLHRIEPVRERQKEGKRYWYVGDTMKLMSATEDGGAEGSARFKAGNYFTNLHEGLEYLGRFCDVLKDRLAK